MVMKKPCPGIYLKSCEGTDLDALDNKTFIDFLCVQEENQFADSVVMQQCNLQLLKRRLSTAQLACVMHCLYALDSVTFKSNEFFV